MVLYVKMIIKVDNIINCYFILIITMVIMFIDNYFLTHIGEQLFNYVEDKKLFIHFIFFHFPQHLKFFCYV